MNKIIIRKENAEQNRIISPNYDIILFQIIKK